MIFNHQRFFIKNDMWVKSGIELSENEKQVILSYIDHVHYLGCGGKSNIKSYGMMVEDYEIWAGIIGKLPSLNTWFYSFSKTDYDWVNSNVTQIGRLVCHYKEDAAKLLKCFQIWAISNNFKYIESYPSDDKKEVCNKQFFEDAGFKCYGLTKREKSYKMIKTLCGDSIEILRPVGENGKMPHHSPPGRTQICFHRKKEIPIIQKRLKMDVIK